MSGRAAAGEGNREPRGAWTGDAPRGAGRVLAEQPVQELHPVLPEQALAAPVQRLNRECQADHTRRRDDQRGAQADGEPGAPKHTRPDRTYSLGTDDGPRSATQPATDDGAESRC